MREAFVLGSMCRHEGTIPIALLAYSSFVFDSPGMWWGGRARVELSDQ
jgi:hypothetical protein